jgi:hypothetical protein
MNLTNPDASTILCCTILFAQTIKDGCLERNWKGLDEEDCVVKFNATGVMGVTREAVWERGMGERVR